MNQAFNCLKEFEEKFRKQSARLPEPIIERRGWLGIGFHVLQESFVVPLNEVAEVLHCPTMTPMPGVAIWLKGLAHLRGRIFPIADLQGFFEGQLLPEEKKNRVLVVETAEILCGFLVEKIDGLQRFNEKTEKVFVQPTAYSKFVTGTVSNAHDKWHVLSLASVVSSEKFFRITSL